MDYLFFLFTNSLLLPRVEEYMSSAFPGYRDVELAVIIDIGSAYLPASPHVPFFDGVACELQFFRVPCVRVETRLLVASGIPTVMGVKAFAGNQFAFAVSVEVQPSGAHAVEKNYRRSSALSIGSCRL